MYTPYSISSHLNFAGSHLIQLFRVCLRARPVSRSLLMVLAVPLILPAYSFGQNDRATVSGKIVDKTGAVIVNAHVSLTDVDTGARYTGSTNSSGLYNVPGLPVGPYTLEVNQQGFRDYQLTGIVLIAAQVAELNVIMQIGTSSQTVTVTSDAPLLNAETSSVATTLETTALQGLPLNASGGQDALNLALATTPSTVGSNGTNQDFISIAGQPALSNSVYLNGVESTTGLQGNSATPSRDALQEIQLMNSVADAEFGTGTAELFQIKSGTNRFHGTAFWILQNEDLNANTWSNKWYASSTCNGSASCLAGYARKRNRFNEYGGSAGGPILHNKTFVFGDYDHYTATNLVQNPNNATVPTANMLGHGTANPGYYDFSELLTGGTHSGPIPGQTNPCTGQPYLYGQIFDPATTQTINGVTCSSPFPGNLIPASRVSNIGKQLASIYYQDYQPTLTTRPYSNYPTLLSASSAFVTKTSMDFRVDHQFSASHHLSGTFERAIWSNPAGLNFLYDQNPLTEYFISSLPSNIIQVTDNYTFRPNLMNTASVEFSEQINKQYPGVTLDPTKYGFPAGSNAFPSITYASSNGVGVTQSYYNQVDDYYGYYGYHYQDTLYWTEGRHNVKFGGVFAARGMNSSYGGNVQIYAFSNQTGGLTSSAINPWVGSSFANALLGDVNNGSVQLETYGYPRIKTLGLFVQDDYKITPKLTLNLGVRWDFNTRGKAQNGKWQNFDLNANNPNWGNVLGAWNFATNSSQSFMVNQALRQFAPRIGGAYQISPKLVARASFGLFWVPIDVLNSGYGQSYPMNQNSLSYPLQVVTNSVPGSVAFNWDNGFPVAPAIGPQNNTNTSLGTSSAPLNMDPNYLHMGYTQNWYAGIEYQLSPRNAFDISYIANRGNNLESSGLSFVENYPLWSTYQAVLAAGGTSLLNSTISTQAQATAAGVPYPYAGFSGPAYAAIAPYPQVARVGSKISTFGSRGYGGVSAFNSIVFDYKARSSHGLYADFNYTISKLTGNQSTSNGNWGGSTTSYGQNLADAMDARHWLQSTDQRQILKGTFTYMLPFGKGQKWFASTPSVLNELVGGWQLGGYLQYNSGVPMTQVSSSFQLPYYFSTDRAFLSSGRTPYSMPHNYHKGNLDLANPTDPINQDFSPSLFQPTTAANPFGNTPYLWNHWRWNATPAQENASIVKNFGFAKEDRVKMVLAAQFFNVLNRHYYAAPSTSQSSTSFGNVTSVSGNRTGQVTFKVTW
jgi:Carboxypeptidase regulatory-like domain